MVSNKEKALGIIFPNTYDTMVPELVQERLMASIPFASRYRMVDFVLSSMVNSGIDNISLIVHKNYHSLVDHIGSGREWDLSRKNGGLNIVAPFSERTSVGQFKGRVDALTSVIPFLSNQKEKYVVLSDANIAVNFDYKALIKAHIDSGADVTIAYREGEITQKIRESENVAKERYFTYLMDEDQKITKIEINTKDTGVKNISLNTYVFDREFLIKQIQEAGLLGKTQIERDILIPHLGEWKIQGYKYDGYVACISGIKSYFDENMRLLDEKNLDALFLGNPIYTKIRDDNPTRYIGNAKVKNSMLADGCIVEGEVENSVIFRGVKIGKGAKVKNCVIMQDTVIEDGASLEYVITDKKVTITANKSLKGEDNYPSFIAKRKTV